MSPRTITIIPQIFDLLDLPLDHSEFKDTRQRPFKSLKYVVERTLLGELVRQWVKDRKLELNSPKILSTERALIENIDFEERFINLSKDIFEAHRSDNKKWLRQLKKRNCSPPA